MVRSAQVTRTTTETSISVDLRIDGTGQYAVQTPIPFFNHMLELFARHGLFDLTLNATGDTAVDCHHTVEDIGICLGQAVRQALGEKKGIKRYGEATAPMDEALARANLDISGRPYLVFRVPALQGKVGAFDLELVEDFFQAFVNNSATTLHISVLSGRNFHHMVEAIFKAFARALDDATQIDARVAGIPSTKGTL